MADLLDILLDESEFYQNKAVDAANNVIEGRLRNYGWKYVMKLPNINPDDIKDLGSNCFLVPSESKDGEFYLVDMNMRTCTCQVGVIGNLPA